MGAAQGVTNLDEFLRQKVSLSVLAQYYLYYAPVVLAQTASMAALIAATRSR